MPSVRRGGRLTPALPATHAVDRLRRGKVEEGDAKLRRAAGEVQGAELCRREVASGWMLPTLSCSCPSTSLLSVAVARSSLPHAPVLVPEGGSGSTRAEGCGRRRAKMSSLQRFVVNGSNTVDGRQRAGGGAGSHACARRHHTELEPALPSSYAQAPDDAYIFAWGVEVAAAPAPTKVAP
jgi:hypothetical protein